MEKKILKAMFANATSKEEMRPVMMGIHFEDGECCGSDGHVLVLYRHGIKKFEGKTINVDGQEIEGRYPNYLSVIPKEREEYPEKLDLKSIYEAGKYHQRKPDAHSRDVLVIDHKGYLVNTLMRALNVYAVAGMLDNAVMYKTPVDRPTVIESKELLSIVMPVAEVEEKEIDAERQELEPVFISLDAFLNDYAFNSWKKPEKPKSWLD